MSPDDLQVAGRWSADAIRAAASDWALQNAETLREVQEDAAATRFCREYGIPLIGEAGGNAPAWHPDTTNAPTPWECAHVGMNDAWLRPVIAAIDADITNAKHDPQPPALPTPGGIRPRPETGKVLEPKGAGSVVPLAPTSPKGAASGGPLCNAPIRRLDGTIRKLCENPVSAEGDHCHHHPDAG